MPDEIGRLKKSAVFPYIDDTAWFALSWRFDLGNADQLVDQFLSAIRPKNQKKYMRLTRKFCLAALLVAAASVHPSIAGEEDDSNDTAYPISHVVVIFQENVSFDHYFATYPFAQNLPGEPAFHAKKGTPSVNGLNEALLTKNPNSLQPQRIDRSHVNTADQDHEYQAEQEAFDHGLMDKFVQFTGTPQGGGPSRVMDYLDGNSVTALWNYAQHFALSDNSYNTTFGPSTPGCLNLISGNTHGGDPYRLGRHNRSRNAV